MREASATPWTRTIPLSQIYSPDQPRISSFDALRSSAIDMTTSGPCAVRAPRTAARPVCSSALNSRGKNSSRSVEFVCSRRGRLIVLLSDRGAIRRRVDADEVEAVLRWRCRLSSPGIAKRNCRLFSRTRSSAPQERASSAAPVGPGQNLERMPPRRSAAEFRRSFSVSVNLTRTTRPEISVRA